MRPWVRAYLGREVEGMGTWGGLGAEEEEEEEEGGWFGGGGEGFGGRRKGRAPVGEAWFVEGTMRNWTPAILRKVWKGC